MATIEERFVQKFAKSAEWHERGKTLLAGGTTHQTRFTSPYPVYFEHAEGPFKYDVDGNQIIDYVMGHGSLMMGNSPPEIQAAITAEVGRGTHFGAAAVHEDNHAELIKSLMPSIDRVRFAASGTEATYLALRLARAFSRKTKIVKFREHFHGWHDYVTLESGQSSGGVPQAVQDTVIVSPADASELDRILSQDSDIAAVIVECNGAHYGSFPLQNPQFLQDIREVTAKHGVIFIMDEVITGFRLSPGGAQGRWDLEPDMTTMAKVMGGGLPGAAVGGKTEIMNHMEVRGDSDWDAVHRVSQGGTHNAHRLMAAAGIATLEAIATGEVTARADAMALRLRDGLNEVFIQNEVTGHAHGIASIVHVNLGADCNCNRELCTMAYEDIYRTMPAEKMRSLRRAMLVNGVDMMGGRAFMGSSAFDEEVVDRTIEAFSQSLKDLRAEAAL